MSASDGGLQGRAQLCASSLRSRFLCYEFSLLPLCATFLRLPPLAPPALPASHTSLQVPMHAASSPRAVANNTQCLVFNAISEFCAIK